MSVAGLAGLALAFRLPAHGVGRPDAAPEEAAR